MLTPRKETIAYLIWCHCEPIGWDCSISDLSEAIGIDARVIGRVVRLKGWRTRLRAPKSAASFHAHMDGSRNLGIDGLNSLTGGVEPVKI